MVDLNFNFEIQNLEITKMANAQTFELNPNRDSKIVAKLTGQAATVYSAMVSVNRPISGKELDDFIQANMPFKTRQDSLRVTLYYLVLGKKNLYLASRESASNIVPQSAPWDEIVKISSNGEFYEIEWKNGTISQHESAGNLLDVLE
jgi:hypothetical protein